MGGGIQHFSVGPRPLGFWFWGFGAKGLGPGLDNCELVLNDSFFYQEKFKMTKSEFQFCPRWKQIDMRKKTGLF